MGGQYDRSKGGTGNRNKCRGVGRGVGLARKREAEGWAGAQVRKVPLKLRESPELESLRPEMTKLLLADRALVEMGAKAYVGEHRRRSGKGERGGVLDVSQ